MRLRQLLSDKPAKTSLSEKLKEATKNIGNSVPSLFNYEKSVTSNIKSYFESTAEHRNQSMNDLYLCVRQQGSLVKAYLCHKGQLLEEVPAKNLAACFMGALSSLGDESKVTQSVGRYLASCSHEHQVSLKELSILIRCSDDHVTIMAYALGKLDEKIPLGDLINFFKA